MSAAMRQTPQSYTLLHVQCDFLRSKGAETKQAKAAFAEAELARDKAQVDSLQWQIKYEETEDKLKRVWKEMLPRMRDLKKSEIDAAVAKIRWPEGFCRRDIAAG